MTLGASPPDSGLARRAEELVATALPRFLANHSLRSWAWSVALARRDRVRYDAELLYVAALLHDVGLVAEYDTGRCFEVDGGRAAARLAGEEGWPAERREALAEAIRLHVGLEPALADGPEGYLLWHGTGLDVTGHRHGDLDRETVDAVLARHPRLDFADGFTALLADQAARKPSCWAAEAVAGGIGERIAAAPFEAGGS